MPAHLNSDVRIETRAEGAELKLLIRSNTLGRWLLRRVEATDDGP